MKSITPGSFISIYPPKDHRSQRRGPLITIRTATLVELLGHAREWDAKYPALAGVSRAYLLSSFAFADDFCGFVEQERTAPPKPKTGRVKGFLLCLALFLVLLSPAAAKAQDLNAEVGARRWTEVDPLYWVYWIWNPSDIPVSVFSITLNREIPYGWIWITAAGWDAYQITGDSVTFVGRDGYEVAPGSWGCCFLIYSPTWNDAPIDYQLVGLWPGSDQGKATWGKTYGHSAY